MSGALSPEPDRPQRVLVTGGSGFIGSNLVEWLQRRGHEVRNLDIAEPEAGMRPAWCRADLLDRQALVRTIAGFQPEFIVHLAARTDLLGARVDDYPANTEGVSNLIDAAAASAALRRIVFASSRLVCRIGYQPRDDDDTCPTTAYGASKVIGEQRVRAASALRCDWTIVRPTSIWGPRFGVPYRNFFDAVRSGRYIHPRGVRVPKSFGYVGNTVVQLERLMFAPADRVHRRTFYLADYEPIEVLAWGQTIARAFGVAPIREVPLALLRLLARSGDALAALGWKSVPLTSFRLDNLVQPMLHDLEPLRAVCGPLPVTTADGVGRTVEWLRARPA